MLGPSRCRTPPRAKACCASPRRCPPTCTASWRRSGRSCPPTTRRIGRASRWRKWPRQTQRTRLLYLAKRDGRVGRPILSRIFTLKQTLLLYACSNAAPTARAARRGRGAPGRARARCGGSSDQRPGHSALKNKFSQNFRRPPRVVFVLGVASLINSLTSGK